MIEFRVEKAFHKNTYQVWLFERRNGQTYIAKPVQLEFVPAPANYMLPDATLEMQTEVAHELVPQIRKQLAGLSYWDNKEEYDQAKRVEAAMQAHIDSLKLVVERTVEKKGSDEGR